MSHWVNRRDLLKAAGAAAAFAAVSRSPVRAENELQFEISVSESSLARMLDEKKVDHLDFAKVAGSQLDISAVEYASRFFAGKAHDSKYLEEMNKRAAEYDVRQLLIVVDGEGRIADADAAARKKALQNHRKWVDAAKALGCHSIQVNPASSGAAQEQQQRAAEGIAELCHYAEVQKINVLLGNYGGISANAEWVVSVVQAVNHPNCGTLPEVANLRTNEDFERLAALVALAKGISAKTRDFDSEGREKNTDYFRALRKAQEAGYRGYVGIHYAGNDMGEIEGILATKKLLERVRANMG